MHIMTMSRHAWDDLLDARARRRPVSPEASAAHRLYGPIAGASGRFVLAQVGQSLDGRVATVSGDARDISGPEGLRHLHRCRALVDAVIVGSGTVRMDNPRLSVREVEGPHPVRVVIDCNGELDGQETLFHDGGAPVIVIRSDRARAVHRGHADVVHLPAGVDGLDPAAILEALAERGLHRILVEGGARTIARFIGKGLVDRLHVSVAPLIIGSGQPGIALPPVDRLSSALRPPMDVYALGSDVIFDCHLAQPPAGDHDNGVQDVRIAEPC